MRVEYSGRNLSLTDALKTKAEKKLAKLERFTGPIVSAHASFEVEKNLHRVNLVVHCSRERIYKASGLAEDMYMAINDAADAIEQQAKKDKTRRLARRSRGAESGAEGASEEEEGEDEGESPPPRARRRPPPISRREDLFLPKPLSVEDAALLLLERGDPVLVFREVQTGRLAVVFQSRKEGIGVVLPEAKS
ncbi:MAG: ribosome hibernation-promoting factor, HPF/YfiA family [Acidobacteriota bacterium]